MVAPTPMPTDTLVLSPGLRVGVEVSAGVLSVARPALMAFEKGNQLIW